MDKYKFPVQRRSSGAVPVRVPDSEQANRQSPYCCTERAEIEGPVQPGSVRKRDKANVNRWTYPLLPFLLTSGNDGRFVIFRVELGDIQPLARFLLQQLDSCFQTFQSPEDQRNLFPRFIDAFDAGSRRIP